MSHVAAQETKPGEPVFADLTCLDRACEMLGLVMEERSNYKWWGRTVGDYPVPNGMKAEDLGKNAKYVLRISDEKKQELHLSDAYEIGIVEDPNNPGCYLPVYDFFNGGYGLDKIVGEPITKGEKVTCLAPKLKQYYDMCCDAAAAREVGDTVDFMTAKEAHERYPEQVPQTDDEETMVSIVNTTVRVGY